MNKPLKEQLMAKRRPVSDHCAICRLPIEEIGGKRLVCTLFEGVKIGHIDTPPVTYGFLASIRRPHYFRRLSGKFDQTVVHFWGSLWDEDRIENTLEFAQNGERPWFCQKCSGRALCGKCGSPRVWAPGAESMDDHGKVSHGSILGVATPCSKCESGDIKTKRNEEGD
ncbi:MAG: hypothetical protein ACOCVM_00365 [Desulfovibrionaceae bacterium]